jgi:hypothetical protein
MEFIEVRNPPEFTMEVERWTRETDADGAAMAVVTGQLFNNTWFNKQENERRDSTALVTLAAGGWTGSAPPYVQSVAVAGASAGGPDALLVSALEDGASLEVQKAYIKAFGIVSSGTAVLGDGVAVFKVYKRPETDITVGLRGVMP